MLGKRRWKKKGGADKMSRTMQILQLKKSAEIMVTRSDARA